MVRTLFGTKSNFAPKREEMKKLAALSLSLFLVSGTAIADTPKNADPQPANSAHPAKPKAAKKAEKSDAAIAAQLEELRQTLQSQQEQLQTLKEELAKHDRRSEIHRGCAQLHGQRLEGQQRSPQDHCGQGASRLSENLRGRPFRDPLQGCQPHPRRLHRC